MRTRKRIAEGGIAPHADTCACGSRIIRHRRVGGAAVVLDMEPAAALAPAGDGRFVLFMGVAIADPDPRNIPDGMPSYREHACSPLAP